MAGITLAQAEAKLTLWLTANEAIAERGQSYSINGRSLSRADLPAIRDEIKFWNSEVQRLSRGKGLRIMNAAPLD